MREMPNGGARRGRVVAGGDRTEERTEAISDREREPRRDIGERGEKLGGGCVRKKAGV